MPDVSYRANDARRAVDDDVQIEFLSSVCGYNLHRATYRLATDFLRSLSDTGMRPVLVSILSIIDENPGISQGAVGQTLGIARTNIAPLMSELQTLKLLRRTRHKSDRRVFEIHLTDEGERVLGECKALIRAHENRMLKNLTDSERRGLVALLNKIR
jgi:DNA-binding MarR family transcriptional regulator